MLDTLATSAAEQISQLNSSVAIIGGAIIGVSLAIATILVVRKMIRKV